MDKINEWGNRDRNSEGSEKRVENSSAISRSKTPFMKNGNARESTTEHNQNGFDPKQAYGVVIPQNLEIPEVLIMGESRKLTIKQFMEVPELVHPSNIGRAKELGNLCYDVKAMKMLTVFLYYCIKVYYEIDFQGLEIHYQRVLRDDYMQLGMKIELQRYSQFAGKVLNIGKKQCAHMIYFLVYGRFATDCYIEAIFNNRLLDNPRSASQKKRIETQLACDDHHRERLSKVKKTSNSIISGGPSRSNSKKVSNAVLFRGRDKVNEHSAHIKNEIQILAEDLSQIFTSTTPNFTSKTQHNNRNSLLEVNQKGNKENLSWKASEAEKKYYMSYYPNRVANQEKSALMDYVLPSTSKNTQKMMRRRKFDHSLIEKMMEKTYFKPDVVRQNQKENKKQESDRRDKRFTTNNNINMANELYKSEGSEFDKIRSCLKDKSCQSKKKLTMQNCNNLISEREQQYNRIKNKPKTTVTNNQRKIQPVFCEETKDEYKEENCFVNLLRKKYPKNSGIAEKMTQKPNLIPENQNEEIYHKAKGEIPPTSRSKLYKYKAEFGKFVKQHQVFIEQTIYN